MKNKKSFTLIELIIASSLVGIIVLAAFSIDGVARSFYLSSVRKSEVTNEANYVMEVIANSMKKATGRNSITISNHSGATAGNLALMETLRVNVADESTLDVTDTVEHVVHECAVTSAVAGGNHSLSIESTEFPNMPAVGGNPALGQHVLLSSRVHDFSFTEINNAEGAIIGVTVSITLRYDPDSAVHPRTNPEVTLESTFYPEQASM